MPDDDDAVAPRATFDRVPDVYHSVRPGYPPALFEALFARLPSRPSVLEVGPGTGQATRDLLARGATVHAVELGPALARKLREVLTDDRLRVTVGDFEHVPAEHAAYECVFAATAYHWITPTAQLDRPAQLLRPGGVLAVVELVQVDASSDHGFFDAAQFIYERYGEGRSGPPPPRRDEVEPALARALDTDARFAGVDVQRFDWDHTYTAAEYRQLMLSYSGTQRMEPSPRQGLLDEMERFVEEHFGGRVTRPLVVTLTTALLAGRSTPRREERDMADDR
jgi:trans-aconitate methyltransferase